MNKKILIVLLVVIVVIIGAIYFLRQPKGGSNTGLNTPATSTGESVNQTSTVAESVSPKTYNVTVENFSFNPAELNIKKGDTVIWTNQDSAPHKISGSSFQSGTLNKGGSFSYTFTTAGTFDYICSVHAYMSGKIIVE